MSNMEYKIYGLKNECGKIVYVGLTKRELVYRMYEHHKMSERKSLTCVLLAKTDKKKKAKELETFYINKYRTAIEGMNIASGMGRTGIGANKTSFQKGNTYCYQGTKSVRCLETGVIYKSVSECAKENNVHVSKVTDCCRGRRKSTNHLHFAYTD